MAPNNNDDGEDNLEFKPLIMKPFGVGSSDSSTNRSLPTFINDDCQILAEIPGDS
jgi:hypothetical protein